MNVWSINSTKYVNIETRNRFLNLSSEKQFRSSHVYHWFKSKAFTSNYKENSFLTTPHLRSKSKRKAQLKLTPINQWKIGEKGDTFGELHMNLNSKLNKSSMFRLKHKRKLLEIMEQDLGSESAHKPMNIKFQLKSGRSPANAEIVDLHRKLEIPCPNIAIRVREWLRIFIEEYQGEGNTARGTQGQR